MLSPGLQQLTQHPQISYCSRSHKLTSRLWHRTYMYQQQNRGSICELQRDDPICQQIAEYCHTIWPQKCMSQLSWTDFYWSHTRIEQEALAFTWAPGHVNTFQTTYLACHSISRQTTNHWFTLLLKTSRRVASKSPKIPTPNDAIWFYKVTRSRKTIADALSQSPAADPSSSDEGRVTSLHHDCGTEHTNNGTEDWGDMLATKRWPPWP